MRSKTSCFNSAVFKKNLTRFAPVWGMYILCLMLGTFLIYNNGGTFKEYHFGKNLTELPQIMSVINLIYAPLVAMLLFGDLYSSRMCYPIHALPVRREGLWLTHMVSGILFSAVPTALMAILDLLLLGNSCFENAHLIPWYTFAAVTLQFICLFGIAIFSIMCSGTKFSMAVIYGLFNFGAHIALWLVDTVYTPMLYGVITPTRLAETLTPVRGFLNDPLMETESLREIEIRFNGHLEDAVTKFTLTDNWANLFIWAIAGLVFALLGLALYRKRRLECAGDALAFKKLEPGFQVIFSLVSACFAHYFVSTFIGYMVAESQGYLFLGAGLMVGWFASQMLIERSNRVFQLKNWLRLGLLTGILAISLVLTYFDVFGISSWQPKVEDIQSISFGGRYSAHVELTDKEDFQKILLMQQEALEERLTQDGPYVLAADGTYVYNIDSNSSLIGKEQSEITDCRFVFRTQINYTFKSGKQVSRICWIWADGPGADAARDFMSRWDSCINKQGEQSNHLSIVLATLDEVYIDGLNEPIRHPNITFVEGLLDAIEKDCLEHTMAQNYTLHSGYFQSKTANEYGEKYKNHSIYIFLNGKEFGWSVEIYPDSRHTVSYLQEHGLLQYDIVRRNLHYN